MLLAWRNIWRKRWRSLLTISAVVVVVYLTLLQFSFSGAAENAMYRSLIESSGHIQIHVQGYRDLREFADGLLRDADDLRAQLEAVSYEAGQPPQIVATLEAPGLLEGEGRARGVLLQGIDQPAAIQQRFAERYLEAGSLPEADDLEGIALGVRLARALQVAIGDVVYLYAPGTEGYGAAAYEVRGLVSLPGSEGMALTSLAAAQELAAPGAVSRFSLHFDDGRPLSTEAQQARKQHLIAALSWQGLELETWDEVNPDMAAYLEMMPTITQVFALIFFVLAGLLVMNTVYLSIIERVREFGVIMALGAARRKVFVMVLSESVLLCSVGALVGVALGLGHIALMAQGVEIPGTQDLFAELGLPSVLYPSVRNSDVLLTALFSFGTGVLAALFPAWTAGKLVPVEAMRFAA